MNQLDSWMTAAIAIAAVAQAVFAGLLWRLMARKPTSVGAVLELRRPDPGQPQRAWLRIENASPIGIEHKQLELYLTAKTRRIGPEKIDLRISIAPWGWREIEITKQLVDMAMKVDSADPFWQGGAHSVDVIFKPFYTAEGSYLMGRNSSYRVDLSGTNFQSVELSAEAAGHIMPL